MDTLSARPSGLRGFLASYLQPLVFVIGFPLAFVSALHAPHPHDLPLALVGPTAVVDRVATALDETAEFVVTHTDDPSAATQSVREREAVGSVQIMPTASADPGVPGAFLVTTFVASGAGLAAAGAVQGVGERLAQEFDAVTKVIDLVPLAEGDGSGTGLFLLLTYSTLGGYLVIISLRQFLPRARLQSQYLAAGVTAVFAPLLVFGVSSLFLGDYGASGVFLVGLLGVAMLSTFTVSAVAIAIGQFFGPAASVGIMAIIVFLGFPASGGPMPASMLPEFWGRIHDFYFTAGALESFRSLIYFDGNGLFRWVLQLSAWTVGVVLLTSIVHVSRLLRQQHTRSGVQPEPASGITVDSSGAGHFCPPLPAVPPTTPSAPEGGTRAHP